MGSRSICTADANIWIDLQHAGLTAAVFSLPVAWTTVDVVAAKVQTVSMVELQNLGLRIVELPGAQVLEVVRLAGQYAGPARDDLFALQYARWKGIPLITGDLALRKAAAAEGVDVRGVLWLLDCLIAEGLVSPLRAAAGLNAILKNDGRLPQSEVERRLRAWTGPHGTDQEE